MDVSMKYSIPAVLCVLLFPLSPVLAVAQEDVALPGNIAIVQPGDSIPAEIRNFSGKWYGIWDDILKHILVVEQISAQDDVAVVYGYSAAPSLNIQKAGWTRIKAKFDAGSLKGTLGNGAVVTYKLQPNGTLEATWEQKGAISHATLKKMN